MSDLEATIPTPPTPQPLAGLHLASQQPHPLLQHRRAATASLAPARSSKQPPLFAAAHNSSTRITSSGRTALSSVAQQRFPGFAALLSARPPNSRPSADASRAARYAGTRSTSRTRPPPTAPPGRTTPRRRASPPMPGSTTSATCWRTCSGPWSRGASHAPHAHLERPRLARSVSLPSGCTPSSCMIASPTSIARYLHATTAAYLPLRLRHSSSPAGFVYCSLGVSVIRSTPPSSRSFVLRLLRRVGLLC